MPNLTVCSPSAVVQARYLATRFVSHSTPVVIGIIACELIGQLILHSLALFLFLFFVLFMDRPFAVHYVYCG